MKKWHVEGQGELDFSDCYLANYPPLDLSAYEGDRNYHFYELQNKLLVSQDDNVLWEMFPIIQDVCGSLAKKKAKGIVIPDFEEKVMEATLRVMQIYKNFPYFRAMKLENVAFWKVQEVLFNKNLQLEERTRSLDYIIELQINRELQFECGEGEDEKF